MSEQEWLEGGDPGRLLSFLQHGAKSWIQRLTRAWYRYSVKETSRRKLRLWACACARRVPRIEDEPSFREAIELSERFADGIVSGADLTAAHQAFPKTPEDPPGWIQCTWENVTRPVPSFLLSEDPEEVLCAAWVASGGVAAYPLVSAKRQRTADSLRPDSVVRRQLEILRGEEFKIQACLLRDIFGNPFRPVTIDPACLTWHDATVVKLAQRIYDARSFEDLPILADTLEEAGCTEPDLLAHLRSPAPHVRGCWALDLILGKE
jgi:hypothetical protein